MRCYEPDDEIASSNKGLLKYEGIGALALCLSAFSVAQAAPVTQDRCIAKVLYSEKLPYAPVGSWLVRATLEIIPPGGSTFVTTLYENLPWQKSLRQGDTFRLRCNQPAASDLQLHNLTTRVVSTPHSR
jgi:hypothetical protein